MPKPLRLLAVAAFSVLLAGCPALPDLKPFADSTAQLQQAVDTSHTFMRQELLALPYPEGVGPDSPQHPANILARSWKGRTQAMEALVDYADSLSEIAAAGGTGGENAEALATSLNGLLGALSAPTVPANYVAVVKGLYGIVAQVRASQSFGQAVERADPAIQAIAELMSKDFADLDKILRVLPEKVTKDLKKPHADGLEYRRVLLQRRDALYRKLASDWEGRGEEVDQLDELNAQLEATRAWYDPLAEEIDKTRARIEAERAILRSAERGFRQWAAVHAGLVRAIREHRKPSVRTLVGVALEIRALIEQLRKPS